MNFFFLLSACCRHKGNFWCPKLAFAQSFKNNIHISMQVLFSYDQRVYIGKCSKHWKSPRDYGLTFCLWLWDRSAYLFQLNLRESHLIPRTCSIPKWVICLIVKLSDASIHAWDVIRRHVLYGLKAILGAQTKIWSTSTSISLTLSFFQCNKQ